jgi:hypothetical protein
MPDAEAACKGPVYACRVGLSEELATMAAAAAGHAGPGETVAGILAAEPAAGARVYLCAYASNGRTTWLALDARGEPLADRAAVREAASIAALCEVAAEAAGGGDLGELRSQLVALRLRERPPGIDEAEEAALALERGAAPGRLARLPRRGRRGHAPARAGAGGDRAVAVRGGDEVRRRRRRLARRRRRGRLPARPQLGVAVNLS